MFCWTLTALPSSPPLCYCHSSRTPQSSRPFLRQDLPRRTNIHSTSRVSASSLKQVSMAVSEKEVGQTTIDPETADDYASQAKLLHEFTNISTISKAWMFNSSSGSGSQAMFSIGQVNLMDNSKRTSLLSSFVSKDTDHSVTFHWSPFPVEMVDVSTIIPSPSGSKLLVVRNKDNNSPTKLEIWCFSRLVKEIQIPKSVHGSIFTDGWFEGISWNSEENSIAYIAEESLPLKPTFDYLGYKKESNSDNDPGVWKAQGDWEEHWGETYVGKRKPTLFVVNIESGDVRAVEGIPNSLCLGQVVWAPVSSSHSSKTYLVFVAWKTEDSEQKPSRKLGMKYCYNRPCSLYAIGSPFEAIKSGACDDTVGNDLTAVINLTPTLGSAFFPRFSPDGKSLVFLSAKTSVDTGAHSSTNSLHRIDWPESKIPCSPTNIHDVLPVVMCSADGTFPGLYCPNILSNPWLSDGSTMILCSYWGSTQVILSVNVLSCKVMQVTPIDSKYSWGFLALNGDDILAVSSSPVDLPQLKYGCFNDPDEKPNQICSWDWQDVPNPLHGCSEKVHLLLSSLKFDIMKIPISNNSANVTEGSRKPYEAIFVSSSDSQTKKQSKECPGHGACNPLIVILHGGPHSVSLTSYSKNQAFLAALGYNLLSVNYRGSLGFGEEALQSLPGKIGTQDVNDVLLAIDKIIEMGLADPSKIAVLGGSHGGFLTAHLIGQAPDRFKVAALRNPVCNLSLMVGTSDIPDWCYVEAFGISGQNFYTELPSAEHLNYFLTKSPIFHLSKVKTPALFLLGAQDLRVPVSNGLQYARALKEKGGEVKVIVFPNDNHAVERPQSDFECFLNIGVWFKKHF